MFHLCPNCFCQNKKSSESLSTPCFECGEEMQSFESREEMIESIQKTKFKLNKSFPGINSFSASEYVWSDLEMLRKRGQSVFTIDQQSKNSSLTKIEIGTQFIELAKENILKKAA